jgi:hypothetical protein
MASHNFQMGVGSGLEIMKRGSAAAHGGKPSAYRQAAVRNSGGSASARGIASKKRVPAGKPGAFRHVLRQSRQPDPRLSLAHG